MFPPPQGQQLLLASLDSVDQVVTAAQQVFLPAMAVWATELGKMESDLIPTFLNRINSLVKVGNRDCDYWPLLFFFLVSVIPQKVMDAFTSFQNHNTYDI